MKAFWKLKTLTKPGTTLFVLTLIALNCISIPAQSALRLRILHERVRPLYRDLTRAEKRAVSPDSDLVAVHREFLRTGRTGLTKLIPDGVCSDNTRTISAAPGCIRYTMPGGGSSFSFRKDRYTIPRLADITFSRNSFQATGALLQGFFVNLGNVSIEDVNLSTPGLGFVANFRPPVNYRSAARADLIFSRGYLFNGFVYRRALFTRENSTFVLRSVAYRAKFFKSVSGITYNEFDFDKRRDVIIAFRIVRAHDDGSITILWKELSNRKAPKLTFRRKAR